MGRKRYSGVGISHQSVAKYAVYFHPLIFLLLITTCVIKLSVIYPRNVRKRF